MKKRAEVKVEGIVQGVGFRPFCYRTAVRIGLTGSVKNTGDAGVRIILEGKKKSIEKFLDVLKNNAPPTARVDTTEVNWMEETAGPDQFQILKSDEKKSEKSSVIPPDIGLCDDCYREMRDPDDRRYHYPFITCVNCGPRFTVIEDLPYDRKRTSMREFPLCDDCQSEYEDPMDRRYHAEPIGCPRQGPEMKLYNSDGSEIDSPNPIKRAAELLDDRKIIAIKGIGGIHVATKTTEDSALEELRKRFRRPEQPLAIMSKDLETVQKFARVNGKREKLLTSNRRPITILKKRDNFPLSELIAPGLDSVGVMLPYSGIHYLLFHYGKDPAYVMTSANLSGLPMITENSEALSGLSKEVDYFLLHNRRIVNRCDDSVVRISGESPVFLRRSRGYVPIPIETGTESEKQILALGAELDNTISISGDGRIFPSQYIGDMKNLETTNYLKQTARKFLELLGIEEPEFIVCDLHPDFETTRLTSEMAEKSGAEMVQIQHHRAHLYSLIAERNVDELVGIAADGIGYGEDGTIWGGEIMTVSPEGSERVGGIKQYPLPGGDLATEFPARALAGILWEENESGEIQAILEKHCQDWLRDGESNVIIKKLQSGLNTPQTSSTGRVLDAISCALGICGKRTYEGEPAIKLEAAASNGKAGQVNLEAPIRKRKGMKMIDVGKLISEVIEKVEKETKRKHIAAAAQESLAKSLAKIAVDEAQDRGVKNIGASGGVFYNDAITKALQEIISGEGLRFVRHKNVPPGDGGISVGQAFSAMKNC